MVRSLCKTFKLFPGQGLGYESKNKIWWCCCLCSIFYQAWLLTRPLDEFHTVDCVCVNVFSWSDTSIAYLICLQSSGSLAFGVVCALNLNLWPFCSHMSSRGLSCKLSMTILFFFYLLFCRSSVHVPTWVLLGGGLLISVLLVEIVYRRFIRRRRYLSKHQLVEEGQNLLTEQDLGS